MTDARSAWTDTGERMQKFGARVKAHYDSERGGDDEQARKEVADALKKADSQINSALSTF